jgi:hypothetical protein
VVWRRLRDDEVRMVPEPATSRQHVASFVRELGVSLGAALSQIDPPSGVASETFRVQWSSERLVRGITVVWGVSPTFQLEKNYPLHALEE